MEEQFTAIEQLRKDGDHYLSRKKYAEAIDAYKAVLVQEPHDFLSLRGLMFAAAHIRDIDDLSVIHREGAEDFTYDFDLALEVIGGSSEEDKKYFADFEKIYSGIKRFSDCKEEIESLGNDKITTEAYIKHNEKLCRRQYISHRIGHSHPIREFITQWINCAILVLSGIAIYIFIRPTASTMLMITVAFALLICGLAAYNIFFVIPRMKKVKEFNQIIAGLKAESANIDEKIKSAEEEREKLSDDLYSSIDEFTMRDKRMMIHGYGKSSIM